MIFFCLQSIFIWVCFDSLYIYECIDTNIFKKRDHDYTLYTLKEIDYFVIKDNNKIEGYKLKFFEWRENSIFSLLSNYHDWKFLIFTILYH